MRFAPLLKFCISSLAGFLVDNAVFTAALFTLSATGNWNRAECVLWAIIVARAASAAANYLLNRHFVFGAGAAKRVSFARYCALALAILASGYAATALAAHLLDASGFGVTAVKIVCETVLFFLSYRMQKKWVFGGSPAAVERKRRGN